MTGPVMNDLKPLKIHALALFASIALTACSGETAPASPPLEGAAIGGDFELVDENGDTVREADFAGQNRVVYFGYAFCPDVCPVDMQKLGQAMRVLEESDPALAERITPIFVSVDPARDTPEVLTQFTDSFHPRMVGLSGSRAAIDAAAERYGVYYQLGEDDGSGNYLVDHSNNAVLFGPEGEPLAILPLQDSPDAIAETLVRWAR
ncbi:SCO family protein [Parasphingopyxis algicola]|uniref:SCO family protein n=1 Tax=Parasphingopyxis algicola TaxID=2026624 RepID=UPI00159FB234|nr:SCO family protein [Parasphingopyxis algicola]QLC25628.1 SCO family protein [Parasphingopyxis algicola]